MQVSDVTNVSVSVTEVKEGIRVRWIVSVVTV